MPTQFLQFRVGALIHTVGAGVMCLSMGPLLAQSPATQIVKPPNMQLWMDVSTSTQHITPARIVDVALWNSKKPGVPATQQIPPGMHMGERLELLPIKPQAATSGGESGQSSASGQEPPKGRLLLYWGCSATVPAGQPRIIDFSTGASVNAQAFATAFAGRQLAERGAPMKPGYAVFPNEREQKSLPKDGSLVGEHRVLGEGIDESFKFSLSAAQDVMPAIDLHSKGALTGSIALSWTSVTNARGYFLHAMASRGDDIILWSSSDSSDAGMGLFEYLPNAAIERWVKDHTLLAPDVTQCAIAKGILGNKGGMLRMIAYGGEHHFAYPARPANARVAWEPEWAVRVRLKSHTMTMLGDDPRAPKPAPTKDRAILPPDPTILMRDPTNLLRGLLGG